MENGSLVRIVIDKESREEKIEGNLTIPKSSQTLVILALGIASSRFSPRNQYVASVLNKDGVSTLLIDLLTEREEKKMLLQKNIGLIFHFWVRD